MISKQKKVRINYTKNENKQNNNQRKYINNNEDIKIDYNDIYQYNNSEYKNSNNNNNKQSNNIDNNNISSLDKSDKSIALDNSFNKNYNKEKKFVEDAYNTKNIGLLGLSFLSYLGGKAKALFSNDNDTLTNKPTFTEDLIRNDILNRVSIVQCSANNPVEDRFNAIQLKNLNGYYLSVLDGHGGNQIADYANKKLYTYFDCRFNYHKNSDFKLKQKIEDSYIYAFEKVVRLFTYIILFNILQEKECYDIALDAYKKGHGKAAFVGSCVLSIIVHDNILYIANLGDSKAEIYRKTYNEINNNNDNHNKYSSVNLLNSINTSNNISKQEEYKPIKLNNHLNAKSKLEQIRLKNEFPNEKDIVVSHTMGRSYYIKGRLQPTHTLGDYSLKHKVFNQPPLSMEEKYIKKVLKNFNGPYIKSIPQLSSFKLEKEDEFLVLATDGLWDFLTSEDVSYIVSKNKEKGKISKELLQTTLKLAAENQSISTDEVYSCKPGSDKRTIHDDITIMVIDLRNQYKEENIENKNIVNY